MENDKRDSLKEMLVIVGALIITYFLLAHFYGDKFARAWWWWQSLKIDMIQLIVNTEYMQKIQALIYKPRDWKTITFGDSWDLGNIVGGYFRWIFVPILLYFGWNLSKKNPIDTLKHNHSMTTLVKAEVGLWKHLSPLLNLNLIKLPNDKGPWASAKTPLEFARENKLLDEDSKLIKERAEKLYASQLNMVFSGVKNMPMLYKAFFAIFAAYGNWDATSEKYKSGKDQAKRGLIALAVSYFKNPKKLDFSWVDEVLNHNLDHPEINEIIHSHAYTHTMLMSLIEYSRKNGVLASALFFWLRPVDRKLWYCLNNVGRSVSWVETGGIWGHWLAEKTLGEPILGPYVKNTVDAFIEALNNIKLKPPKKYAQVDNKS